MQALNSKTDMGGSNPDEHMLLDDNKYVADVLYDIRSSKQKDLLQSRLLFKKRMFRETDETITEAQFVNLSYVQVLVNLIPADLCEMINNSETMRVLTLVHR